MVEEITREELTNLYACVMSKVRWRGVYIKSITPYTPDGQFAYFGLDTDSGLDHLGEKQVKVRINGV